MVVNLPFPLPADVSLPCLRLAALLTDLSFIHAYGTPSFSPTTAGDGRAVLSGPGVQHPAFHSRSCWSHSTTLPRDLARFALWDKNIYSWCLPMKAKTQGLQVPALGPVATNPTSQGVCCGPNMITPCQYHPEKHTAHRHRQYGQRADHPTSPQAEISKVDRSHHKPERQGVSQSSVAQQASRTPLAKGPGGPTRRKASLCPLSEGDLTSQMGMPSRLLPSGSKLASPSRPSRWA